jgi:hypothetical protein
MANTTNIRCNPSIALVYTSKNHLKSERRFKKITRRDVITGEKTIILLDRSDLTKEVFRLTEV